MDADVAVSNDAWLKLLHAEVCWALAQTHADVLIIKGPSIAEWLYANDGRAASDVDILIRPADWDLAVNALTERGFSDIYEGFREHETALHSLNLRRTDPSLGLHEVDVHRYFPGIEVSPGDAFERMWTDRMQGAQAGVSVWYPSLPARALIIALHAARDAQSPKTSEDLRRAVEALGDSGMSEVRDLAAELEALPALRAGLETRTDTSELVPRLGLSAVAIPTYWQLRSHGADPLTAELARVSSLPMRDRVVAWRRWVLPSVAAMRARDPRAETSNVALAGVYLRRWGSGIRRLPHAIGQIRQTKS